MRDSKPQRCVQHHKPLKVTRIATNGDKHINEACRQAFSNNPLKKLCSYTQGMFSIRKICFNALTIQIYDQILCLLSKINEMFQNMT